MLKDNDFLKIKDYLHKDFPVTVILSDRGLGKTHNAFMLCDEVAKDNKQFVLARLTMEPFKKSRADIEKIDGFKVSLSSSCVNKDDKIVGHLTSLNTYANTKGGTYNDVTFMVFDEFNEDIYIENAFAKFVMMVDSFMRHRKDFKCVLLGNMINKNNWMLNSVGIRPNWQAPNDQIFDLDEFGIRVVIIGTQTFNKISKERFRVSKLASADPAAHAFYNEREFLNDESDYVVNFKKFVEPTFQPLFIFRLLQNKYIFGCYLEENGEKYFFTDRYNVFHKNYKDLPEFSFDILGNVGSKKTKVLDDSDVEDFQQKFFQIAKEERLRYGSFDSYEELARFISLGSVI